MPACTKCNAPLETPLGCAACGQLAELREDTSPFALFGLEDGSEVDAGELKKKLLRFSRISHPDFYATEAPAERELAERNTAALNEAYELLIDDFARADWLIRHLGGPDENEERQMPQAFLMEVLEWNEELEQAETSSDPLPTSLLSLESTWLDERNATLDAVHSQLADSPQDTSQLAQIRKQLNAVRYLDRTLSKLKSLKLSKAAAH